VHRQRAQEQGVDQAEDRGVGADAERQRKRRDEREDRARYQHPGRVPQVTSEVFHMTGPAHIAAPFLDLGHTAESAQSGMAGLARGHARRDVLRDELIEMEGQLGRELCLDLGPPEQGSGTKTQLVRSTHAGRPFVRVRPNARRG